MRNGEQTSLLDEIDRREATKREMELAKIRQKLEAEYIHPREKYGTGNPDALPDGLVVIAGMTTYGANGTNRHYYRCVVGHHRTVAGPMAHIISAPNAEWPDVPMWQASHGCQWIYPNHELWMRKEEEWQPDIRWTEDW